MSNILFSLKAVLPILITVFCGMVFAGKMQWGKDFYVRLNSLIFKVLFPVNLFYSVYSVEDISAINFKALAYIMASTFICAGFGWAASVFFIRKNEQKCVIMQASFRSNIAVIGLALVAAVSGENAVQASAFASITICGGTIVNNILAVSLLSYYGGEKKTPKSVLSAIVRNPLVIGAMLGLVCVVIRKLWLFDSRIRLNTMLPSIFNVIASLSRASAPLALFCLGAVLDLKAGGNMIREISVGIILRLLICPVTILGTALLFKTPLGLTSIETPALIAYSASPVAISSAIMVQEMGGDSQLANHLVVWSSAFSTFTLFIFIAMLKSIGML